MFNLKLILVLGLFASTVLAGYASFVNTNTNSVSSLESTPKPTPAQATSMIGAPKPIDTFKPAEGYVPDAETAIAIAVAVWNPIYGKEKILGEKPYRASLENGVWTVRGSLPRGRVGGVAEVDISKDDGRILRLIHGK